MTVGLVALLMVACSAPAEPGRATASPATPASPATASPSELTVVIDDGAGNRRTWRLRCDPPGGDHPDPEAACRALEAHASALRPVGKDRACTEIYGGPETATIRGTWRGQPVLTTLSRTNGCEIARWDALVGLLPRGGA